ncbi:hypothetical protein, partial [Allokutzneria sp. NRRL B-24872]|uniref:hypothetical protein n=1 Tax=Allokutzneria sp. NRRL B-24872 TaxID=1137961 RepID=UPI001AEF7245
MIIVVPVVGRATRTRTAESPRILGDEHHDPQHAAEASAPRHTRCARAPAPRPSKPSSRRTGCSRDF